MNALSLLEPPSSPSTHFDPTAGDGRIFTSPAPGHWPEVPPSQWNDWKWQLKNRVTTLERLEELLELEEELLELSSAFFSPG